MRKRKYAYAGGVVLLAALAGCGAAPAGPGSLGPAQGAATSPASSAMTATAPSTSALSTTSPPTTAPSATTPASWAWCSSATLGQQTTPDGRFDLYNNKWNTAYNPGPQTICGNSESDWQVTSNQRAGNTGVLTYPSVQLNYNGGNGYALSRFSSMTSSWAEQMPSVSGLDAEAAYDIWLNGLNKEVMVWVDNHGQTPAGSKMATYSISGATWDLYVTGGYMAFVREGNATSGSVDLFAMLKDLEDRGLLPSSATLWQVNFGWEICSTGGQPASFSVTSYSLTSTPSS